MDAELPLERLPFSTPRPWRRRVSYIVLNGKTWVKYRDRFAGAWTNRLFKGLGRRTIPVLSHAGSHEMRGSSPLLKALLSFCGKTLIAVRMVNWIYSETAAQAGAG